MTAAQLRTENAALRRVLAAIAETADVPMPGNWLADKGKYEIAQIAVAMKVAAIAKHAAEDPARADSLTLTLRDTYARTVSYKSGGDQS